MYLNPSKEFSYTKVRQVINSKEKSPSIRDDNNAVKCQPSSTKKRSLYLDQIKALIVALVIALHVPMVFGMGWYGIRIAGIIESDPLFAGFFHWYSYVINSFIMYMMFLISGYFVPRSVHKKGIAQYLKDRLLRLGVPFCIGLLLLNNASALLGRLSPSSPFAELPWTNIPFNRVGVLWFLIVLFTFNLLYCAWVGLRGDRYSVDASVPTPRMRSWLISAVVLGILEVVMAMQTNLWTALVHSNLDALGMQGMHIFTYAFLFFLGCKASFHQWFERLDTHLVVKWFRLSVFLTLALLTISLTFSFNPDLPAEYAKVTLLSLYLLYPCMAWGILSYLLLWFQRNEDRFGQWLATAGVNSYGAYVIHSLVLSMVLMAIGFSGLNPWLTVIAATALTTIISFGVAGQLRRIPSVARLI